MIICDQSTNAYRKISFCLGFSKTSHVDSLDIFRNAVAENVYIEIENLKKTVVLKERLTNWNMKINSFSTWDWVILKHVFITVF